MSNLFIWCNWKYEHSVHLPVNLLITYLCTPMHLEALYLPMYFKLQALMHLSHMKPPFLYISVVLLDDACHCFMRSYIR